MIEPAPTAQERIASAWQAAGQPLLYLVAPASLALLYVTGLALSWAGYLVSLDLIVFTALTCAAVAVILFGRMSWFDDRLARVTPLGLFFLLAFFFAIPILEAFRLNVTNVSFMFGFVPWSDAANYVVGGWQMLVDGSLSEWHQRRPINASVMEARLLLSGFDLHALALWNAVVMAFATAYAVVELRKHLGILASGLFTLALFGYAQPFMPSTLSGQVVGLPLGLVAFGALLRATRLGSLWLFVLGLGLLSFALNAQVGAFLMLPAIWLWGVIYLAKDWRGRMVVALLGAAALLSGFAYSLLLIGWFGSGEVMTFNANLADIAYGLTRGGKGYHVARLEHPELYTLGAAARAEVLIRLSVVEIAHHPMRFIGVLSKAFADGVTFILNGPRLRLLHGHAPPTRLSFIFEIVNLVGLFAMLRFAANRRNALILLSVLATLLSAPFILEDGGARVFAPAMPFVFYVLACGARVIGLFYQSSDWAEMRSALSSVVTPCTSTDRATLVVPAVTLAVVVLIPFALAGAGRNLSTAVADSGARCPTGTEEVTFSSKQLMYAVRVHAGEGRIYRSQMDVTYAQLQSTLAGSTHIDRMFRELKGPYTIFGVLAGSHDRRRLQTIIWEGQLRRFESRRAWRLCVTEIEEYLKDRVRLYQVVRALQVSRYSVRSIATRARGAR